MFPFNKSSSYPFVLLLLLGVIAVIAVGAVLFSTWRSMESENSVLTHFPVASHVTASQGPVPDPTVSSVPDAASASTSSPATVQPTVANIAAASTVSGVSGVAEPEASSIPVEPTPVPAVFGAAGNAALSNIPGAIGMEDIAEQFTERVKQGGWDTTSEAYRKNWEKALQEADDLLRARYGTETYLLLKREAGTN